MVFFLFFSYSKRYLNEKLWYLLSETNNASRTSQAFITFVLYIQAYLIAVNMKIKNEIKKILKDGDDFKSHYLLSYTNF